MVWNPAAFNSTVNMSPLLRAIQGYQQGQDQAFDFRTQQNVGGRIAAGDWAGAQSEAAKGGMDVPVLVQLGQKAREEQMRQEQAKALQNPDVVGGLTPQYRAALQALSPEQRAQALADVHNPLTREKLNIQREQMRRAQMDQYGKAGTIVQGGDGQFYSVQFGSNGQKIVEPLMAGGKPLTPAKGTDVVGDVIIDKGTGREVRNVAPNIAGGEQAKVEGKAMGERTTGMSKAEAAMKAADAKHELVMQNLGEAEKMVSGMTAGIGGAGMRIIPGTAAYDMRERLKTVLANSGFDELQTMRDNSPTGGALGAIAVQELEMLQKIRGSLEQTQSPAQLAKVMQEYRSFMAGSKERRRAAFDATFGGVTPMGRQPSTGAPQAPQQQMLQQRIAPEAVQMLRQNPSPELRQKFDEVFGPGAAERALGGR